MPDSSALVRPISVVPDLVKEQSKKQGGKPPKSFNIAMVIMIVCDSDTANLRGGSNANKGSIQV